MMPYSNFLLLLRVEVTSDYIIHTGDKMDAMEILQGYLNMLIGLYHTLYRGGMMAEGRGVMMSF